MQDVCGTLTVGALSFAAWLAVLLALSVARGLPRAAFVVAHYGLDILIFGVGFALYHRYIRYFSPFATMAIAMSSLFTVEFIFWRFFYKGELWFLNFVDWIVPAFLVASTIYFAGLAQQ